MGIEAEGNTRALVGLELLLTRERTRVSSPFVKKTGTVGYGDKERERSEEMGRKFKGV